MATSAQIPQDYPDFLRFYREGPYADYVVETRSAGRNPVEMLKIRQPEGDFSDPAHPDIVLVLPLKVEEKVERNLGAGKFRVRYRAGDLEIVPPNTATDVYCEGDNELIALILPFDAIKKAIEYRIPNFTGDFGPLHKLPFRDNFVEQLCWRLWLESNQDNPYGNLYAEGLLLSLVASLIRLSSPRQDDSSQRQPKLSKKVLKNLDQLLDQTPDHQLSIHDLAALADMPPQDFCHAFEATTGQRLDHYAIDLRVTKAREFLASGRYRLKDIHHLCGFTSPKHMSRLFEEHLGLTPMQYWRELRC